MRQTIARWATIVALGVTTACRDSGGDTPIATPPGDESRRVSIAVDHAQPTLSSREWKSDKGDAAATLVAYFSGDTLRLIRERQALGDLGSSANRYYFASGVLRYYESEGERTETDPARPPGKRKVRLALAFDGAAKLVEGSRTVDEQTAAIDSVEVRGVRERAALLKAEAEHAPAAAKKISP